MDTHSLIREIDAEIAKLQLARQALAAIASSTTPTPAKRLGRPPKTSNAAPVSNRKGRILSPEARAKIAAAQKKRWAAQKKSAKKTA